MKIVRVLIFAAAFAIGCGASFISRPAAPATPPSVAETPVAEAKIARPLAEIDSDAEFRRETAGKLPLSMVETGNGFHGNEIVARNGERWVGLFPDENGVYALRSVNVEVTRAKDEITDKDGEMSGKNVQTKEKTIPVFLLRGAGDLKPGKVEHLFGVGDRTVGEENRDYVSLKNGFSRDFDAGAGRVTLKVVRGLADGENSFALVLERGGDRQTLYVYPFPNPDDAESIGTLYWAGDIDRDGWPDFYMSLFYHDNVDDKVLFLSSRAKKNKIVSLVARFRITGC